MSMARRKKALKPRIYTYEQLESLLRLFYAGKRTTSLYGGVAIGARPSEWPPHIAITYSRWKSKSSWHITLARVYRGSDNSTVYAVTGPPRAADKELRKQQIAAWKRYVTAFTPHHEKRLLACGVWVWYRVKDGGVEHFASQPGVWLHPPRRASMYSPAWGQGLPQRSRRTRLFASRLQKALSSVPDCFVRGVGDRCELHVYTGPTRTTNGRRLVVETRDHDDRSRAFHHIDGDYAIKHLEVLGMSKGQPNYRPDFRWKCTKDAVNGIVEWVLGDIYIPGPDSF